MEKNNKKSGTISNLVAIIILLSLTCAVSIGYNFLGGFFSNRIASFETMLGEEQTINISGNGAYVVSANFAGTLVINSDIKQKITILKVCFCGKDKCGKLFGYTNWVDQTDGYIYLNQPLNANETVGLCEYVRFNCDDIKLQGNLNYIVSFIVEANDSPFSY